MKIFNKKGDTIVEVMLAIVVLSAAMAAALAISNASVSRIYNNHERYQALQYVNMQLELLRLKMAKDANALTMAASPTYSAGFCINNNAAIDYTAVSPSTCVFDNIYNVKVTVAGTEARVLVSWVSLGGRQDRVEIVYAI